MAGVFENTQVGKREDFADYIVNVDAHNTPVLSRIKHDKAPTNTTPKWQVDAYPEPNTAGVLDGKDAANFEDLGRREELFGVVQKFWRKPKVSDFAENVSDVAGIKSEMAEQIRKAFVMIKRDGESRICGFDLEAQLDNGAVPYETRSLGRWIQNNAQAIFPVPEAFRTPTASIDAGAANSRTEETVRTMTKSIWEQTGEKKRLMVPLGSTLKARFSTFASYAPGTGAANPLPLRSWQQRDMTKVLQQVDILENDFAILELMLSNFISVDEPQHRHRRGFILDPDRMSFAYNRKPRVKPLEDQGGGPRAIVDMIGLLKVKNPLGFGKFAATAD